MWRHWQSKGDQFYMAKQKKFAKSPLLYIHQPGVSDPKAPMQSNYATPKKEKQVESTTPKVQSSSPRPLKRDNYFKKALEAKPEASPEKAKVEPKTEDTAEKAKVTTELPDKPAKKFNEMTVTEKVDYFLSKPDHIPSMKCEVKTEERAYRGIITNVEKDHVLMRVGRRTSTTEIAIESIIEIRLIGF